MDMPGFRRLELENSLLPGCSLFANPRVVFCAVSLVSTRPAGNVQDPSQLDVVSPGLHCG